MADMFKDKRVFFPKTKQRAFIERIKEISGLPYKDLALILGITNRTMSDWIREKFSMPYSGVKKLSSLYKIPIPKAVILKDLFWYAKMGASKGGRSVYDKYHRIGGDPIARRDKWNKWWQEKGKFKPHPIINVSIPINKPAKSSNLAELIGIIMGDGGISKYQLVVTLHHIDDKEYSRFVFKLIRRLFRLIPSVNHAPKKSVLNIVVSRKKLVEFLTQELGLKSGNKIKQQIDMPIWIKDNYNYKIACIRGLFDTDGSILTHRYRVSGKRYSYKKIEFSSASRPLLESVAKILGDLGLGPNRNKRHLTISASKNVEKYFEIIGSHNPKHLKRYKE